MSRSGVGLKVLLVLSLFFGPAEADELNLQQALQELTHSPTLEKAQSLKEEASWAKVESYSGFLPTLSANGSYLVGKKYAFLDVQFDGAAAPISFPQVIPTTTLGLTAQWTLFNGFSEIYKLKSAKALERAGENQFEWTRFESERELITLFYRALGAQILKDVAAQNVKTIEDHLNDVRLLKKNGMGTNYDVLRVEVQASEAKSELLNSDDNVSIALLRLGQVLGKEAEDRTLKGKLPALEASVIKDITFQEENRKDLIALRERADAMSDLAGADSKYWVPKIGLFGRYEQYNNRNDSLTDTAAFRDAYSYGVQMSWNIFDGLSSFAKSKQTTERQFQAEKNLRIGQIKSKVDTEFWRRKFLYFCSLYQSRVSDVAKAEESVRLAKEGRRAGVRTSTDLLDAELELFKSRAGVVNSQMGSIEALINFELVTGKRIYSFE